MDGGGRDTFWCLEEPVSPKPDFVHVLINGKIVKSGGPELALDLEKKGGALQSSSSYYKLGSIKLGIKIYWL